MIHMQGNICAKVLSVYSMYKYMYQVVVVGL